ncbi:uncharacterized protein LOC121372323 isoform X2 [Gigantopelta aegis]|uniref:uncharacterized protein LOC121372323 isoform X2 n=1 Tax=Gigantopelta aegis TaxID=1735272 RepID=UPI001B88E664|nr:uncharacterized protein LOC121372323 isoform X2 [Gigantopelta aegis]
MQTYSTRKPQAWKKKYDDAFDKIAAPTEKHQLVESWLRQLPDAPRLPVDSESSIEILRQEVRKPSNLERRPSSSSVIDLIDPYSRDRKKKFNVEKTKPLNTYKITKKRPVFPAPVLKFPALTSRQITRSFTNTVHTGTTDITTTERTESATDTSQNGVTDLDFHKTEDTDSSYTYTWVTASTNSSTDNISSKQESHLKNHQVQDSTPSIHFKTLKKKVLNSTAKNDAKNLESINFSRNLSPIENCNIQYDALRQQQLEESTPYKSRESPVHGPSCQNQKKLQKKAKKPLSSTAVYLSGINIEEKFQGISSIYSDGCTGKSLKPNQDNVVPDSLVDNNAVSNHLEVKAARCVLTSTPVLETTKNHPAALHIDLSSLGSASSCSEDIILLRKSDDEINSEEIVAKSFTDSEVEIPDVKDIHIESQSEKPVVNDQHLDTPVQMKTNKNLLGKNAHKIAIIGKRSKGNRKNKDIKFVSKHRRMSTGREKRQPKIVSKSDYESGLMDRRDPLTTLMHQKA